MKALFKALQLVQDDYLGGHGSRGSGQVDIIIDNIIEKDKDFYIGDQDEEPVAWDETQMKERIPLTLIKKS